MKDFLRGVITTLSAIQDGTFCENSKRLRTGKYFCKKILERVLNTSLGIIGLHKQKIHNFSSFLKTRNTIDGLRLCWLSPKIAHVHISGRKNKNKLKEKHVESIEQLGNRVPTSLYTSFVFVDFGKNMPGSCAAFGCKNWRSITSLQFYRIPSPKRYPEQRITKWVTAKNERLRK